MRLTCDFAVSSVMRARYALDHRRGAFPWQGTPADGADLPDRVPTGMLDLPPGPVDAPARSTRWSPPVER